MSISKVVAEHFYSPRNVGDVAAPAFTGRAASLICGATVRLSLRVDNARIIDAKFKAAGCSTLVASLSLLTEHVKYRTAAEAAVIAQNAENLLVNLEGVESHLSHCPRLACDALITAIQSYSDSQRSEWIGDEALICTCFFISEKTIEHEIATKRLATVADVTGACNAGGGCGSCHQLIQEILDSQMLS
ncbi:MAG: iron-sulfur cluster assembly scaffold protein [Pyrinomonadaceae bacterium]